jgi:hypothetical protein
MTVTYTGTVDWLNYYPYRYPGAPDYDGLLGAFTLTTSIGSGSFTTMPGGYTYTSGFAPYPSDPDCCGAILPPPISDYAYLVGPTMSTSWGGYGATTTLLSGSISQTFQTLAGGPGYIDVALPTLNLSATVGGTGSGYFLIDPGYPSGIEISGSLTIDSTSISGVPEASTWTMLLIGFIGLGMVRTFSRRSALSAI